MQKKHFVGFGFGPIQSGLMLYEAIRSGNFDRYTIAEIDQKLVDMVRADGNAITVNIAHRDRITAERLDGFWIGNPNDAADMRHIAHAIADADEMATAIPSVKFYGSGGASSIAALLAAHLSPDKPQILYASENNNYAAEILGKEIGRFGKTPATFQILDTVIGKMSGVKQSRHDIEELALTPITAGSEKAVLVEEFNRIFISRIRLPLKRGITVFEEKDDLLPFEEAKLYGHNAIHSLLGYFAHSRGYRVMSRIRDDAELLGLGRRAFIEESGAALCAKHGHLGDRLFTPEGYQAYADDLIERMTNPYLHDEVARICRDPQRKLGYGDRIVGTMRVALAQGITPSLMAAAAVAALRYVADQEMVAGAGGREPLPDEFIRERLDEFWRSDPPDQYTPECLRLILLANREWETYSVGCRRVGV